MVTGTENAVIPRGGVMGTADGGNTAILNLTADSCCFYGAFFGICVILCTVFSNI